MNTGTKITLAFLGGAIAGAYGLYCLNKDKMDEEDLKQSAAKLVAMGMSVKDMLLEKMTAVKNDLENLTNDGTNDQKGQTPETARVIEDTEESA